MSMEGGWVDYGVPRRVPSNARMYVLTNEQINFIASLVSGVNDIFSFQIPYPFYVNQQEKAIIYHRIDFILRRRNVGAISAGTLDKLSIDLQYSDKEPAADWDGAGEDGEDENIQAMFDGPFVVGFQGETMAPDTDATLAVLVPVNGLINVHYYPPDGNGLDAFFPVTVVMTNMSADRDLVDQIADAANFSLFESFYVRCYFTERQLTSREREMMQSEYYGLVPYS